MCLLNISGKVDRKLEQINCHGSCGVGVGSTINREENHYSLLFGDLFYPSILSIKLNLIKDFYGFTESIDLNNFLESIKLVLNSNNILSCYDIPSGSSNYIFEGSQGLLLDQKIGFFPNVTRSNTGSKNILDMGFTPDLYLVTRAYQTRHGNGPMTNTEIPNNILNDPNETNVINKYQGEFRRTLLDLDLLLYAINNDEYIRDCSNRTLVITCLDHVQNEFRFTLNGEIINNLNERVFISNISEILGIKHVLISKSNESKYIEKFK